ncbi:MAG: 3-deoxy-8-phosphooctulonate synthase [Nitrospirae bacterium]|nr:3-deoxy-8-phosphooctulonate synthase [Nitrospirota bacterium]
MELNWLFNKKRLFIIAGPCVIESRDLVFETAERLKGICDAFGFPLVFKSSYDKANRSSLKSFRGPGLEKGLQILKEVKERFALPVLTDIHSPEEAREAALVVDVLQVPAFLCRQTDIVLAASRTGKPVNIKKGQFLAPWDMRNVVEKFVSTGNKRLLLTERGVSFGYNNLVVDFRAFPIMQSFGFPVVFDVTHSLQLPGGLGNASGGQREFAPTLARAAVAAGVDGLFMEVHPEPEKALCDGPNMIKLSELEILLKKLKAIREAI